MVKFSDVDAYLGGLGEIGRAAADPLSVSGSLSFGPQDGKKYRRCSASERWQHWWTRTLALRPRRILMGQGFSHTTDKLNRQGLVVRENQVAFRPSVGTKFIDQGFGLGNWWIDPNMLLEGREVEKNLPFTESWHAIANAPLYTSHPLLYDRLYRFQSQPSFG